jgi:hypothetical protein
MVCKHYKNVELLELNDYAINYAQKAVTAYDLATREKIGLLVNQIRGKMTPAPQAPKSKLILPPSLGSVSST